MKLTTQEERAVEALKHTSRRTGWGLATYNIIRFGTPEKIRNLIQQLQSEGLANPSAMADILGADAWERVLECDYMEIDMIELSNGVTIS